MGRSRAAKLISGWLLVALFCVLAGAAHAQNAKVIQTCGTPGFSPQIGALLPVFMDQTGVLCSSGSAGTFTNPTYVAVGNLGFAISNLPPTLAATGSSLNVNITGGVSPGATFGSAFPSTGQAIGFQNGSSNLDYALVDASHFVDVNCQVGCSGGSFNNNSDAVATSATNGQAAAWNYGFNGTTWDRLRVDASKNLDVNVKVGDLTTIGGGAVATAATGILKVGVTDGSGNVISSTSNALNENCTNCLATPTDEGTFTAGSSGFLNVGGFYQTTSTNNPLTTGQFGTFQSTKYRALMAALVDSTGTELNDTTNHGVLVENYTTNNAAYKPHICTNFAKVHITTATNTQILAASGSNNIYICDFEFSAAAAQNFYFEKSSSGTCGSPTQIGILWTLAANESKGANKAIYTGFNTGASQQLCVNTSAAAGIDIGVFYDQY